MMVLTYPGQDVPTWLEKVEVMPNGKLRLFKFSNINLIWKYKDRFHVMALLPLIPIVVIRGNDLKVYGQCGGVVMYSNPLAFLLSKIISKRKGS